MYQTSILYVSITFKFFIMTFQTIVSPSVEQMMDSIAVITNNNPAKGYIVNLEVDNNNYLVALLKVAEGSETFDTESILVYSNSLNQIQFQLNSLATNNPGYIYSLASTLNYNGYVVGVIYKNTRGSEVVTTKKWYGFLTQTPTNSPTADVVINDLPDNDITFSYVNPGEYDMVSASGAFTTRTDIVLNKPSDGDASSNPLLNWSAMRSDANTIKIIIQSYDEVNNEWGPGEGYLNETMLKVEIYPEPS